MTAKPPAEDIRARKDAHLEITASGRGAFRRTTTLLEEVSLVHQALPEGAVSNVDLSVDWMGRRLAAPVVIGAMTGGTDSAAGVNRELARVAQDLGIGFALGSQRVMAERPETTATFRVRDAAPDVALVGNLGLVQARALGPDAVARLAEAVGADGMAVHLNPAQELVQSGGDRDFRGLVQTLGELVRTLPVPLMVKETGCGISAQTGALIAGTGVTWVEVAGAGGTSWTRVEAEREPARSWADEILGEWGIPTAASLAILRDQPFHRIAGGGLRTALDCARALALGASACALAQPVLVAHREGGADGARRFLEHLLEGLRAILLLTGCRRPEDLWTAPRVLGPTLQAWIRGSAS